MHLQFTMQFSSAKLHSNEMVSFETLIIKLRLSNYYVIIA